MMDFSVISADFKGYYVAALTDEYRVGFWPIKDGFDMEAKNGKLLELRVFNEKAEYKWFRGSIGEKFNYRRLADNDESTTEYEEPIDEVQLLDIDFKNKTYKMPGTVRMSKGGNYYLPLVDGELSETDKPGVIVKYYVPKYNAKNATTIHAYVKDWRLAGFIKGVKENGKI